MYRQRLSSALGWAVVYALATVGGIILISAAFLLSLWIGAAAETGEYWIMTGSASSLVLVIAGVSRAQRSGGARAPTTGSNPV